MGLRLNVSNKVSKLEQELVGMQPTCDSLPQYNITKSLMVIESNRI